MNIETIHTPFHTNVLLYFHAFRSSVAKVTKQFFWNHTLVWVLSSTFAVFRSKSSERLFFLSKFSFTDTDNSQDSRGREGTIFFSTEPLPPAPKHLFTTLHVRWLSHIFNRTACICQTATQWDLLPYRITIWVIDDVMLIFVCLLVDLILGFLTAISHEKPVDSYSHLLSSLHSMRTD